MKRGFLLLRGDCGALSERDRRNARRYTASLVVWALSYVACAFLLANDRITGGALGVAVALLPSVAALVAAGFFVHYLWFADEMQRLVELQALALALLAGFVLWPGLRLLGLLGMELPGADDALPMLMIATYTVGIVLGRRRFS